jgi:hypothetical protein
VDHVTRLLLSLLRLLAADRPAARGVNRGRSMGHSRRLVPAAAEAGYGRRGGYACPDHRDPADRGRYPRGGDRRDGSYDGDGFRSGHDGRYDGGFGQADDYGDGFGDADDPGFLDEPGLDDGGYADGSQGYRAADADARDRGRGTSGTAASAAAGARAGRPGPGGRAGVHPPTERFPTEPLDRRGGGAPLTGTVHRPGRGGRGPGSGRGSDPGWGGGPGRGGGRRPRRRRIPLRYKWIAALVVLALIFRRAVAWAVMVALSAALHLVGLGIHLPSIKFGWPWQSVASNSTTTTPVGPWVLQKIEGISKPALGRVNFSFVFTRKVSKDIGPWPCWYQTTFAAVGHASATVALNPGPAWWSPGTGHYQLRVLSAPQGGRPGHVSVRMTLPMPQLPQSAHDVTIDNLPSKPIDVQHSWTYPGFGCGTLLKPQFDNSVLYAEAQQIAYYKSTHVPQVTKPLLAAAETEAVQTVRDNFVQPSVNALGYTLDRFTIAWVAR